ncbi:unnamed protein product [Lactuca virosa]|uniref:Uncharacterized protein n=1 Tax=Lactuca virosa TaxID=75947 RepID=A0AAU9PCC5_9ASTR|nr:unnamed protein product [Lactuca virosa]
MQAKEMIRSMKVSDPSIYLMDHFAFLWMQGMVSIAQNNLLFSLECFEVRFEKHILHLGVDVLDCNLVHRRSEVGEIVVHRSYEADETVVHRRPKADKIGGD